MSSIEFNNDKEFKEEKDDGNENNKLAETNASNNGELKKPKNKRIFQNFKLIIFLIFAFIFCRFYSVSIKTIDIKYLKRANINLNDIKKELNQSNSMRKLNEKNENIISKDNMINIKDDNKKIGVAFVYNTFISKDISKFISLTSDYLIKTGKYDIIFIVGKNINKKYPYNRDIKRFAWENNRELIKNISKTKEIDYFIFHNEVSNNTINFYKSLGRKVIGAFHGIFLSRMLKGSVNEYRNWKNFNLYDSLIFISPYDYFYKNLNFKNAIFIQNLYSFEPSEIIN
jgi:hypothetical protein